MVCGSVAKAAADNLAQIGMSEKSSGCMETGTSRMPDDANEGEDMLRGVAILGSNSSRGGDRDGGV